MEKTFSWRFRNWVNWCNLKGVHNSRAGSAEGNWKSPQIWDERNPTPEWVRLIDHNDAVEINRAYVELDPYPRRVILILYFRTHWRPTWQAQKLNCHVSQLHDKACWARNQLENLLTNKQQGCRNATEVPIPSSLRLTRVRLGQMALDASG